MSSAERDHPVWDLELDGMPYPRASPIPTGSQAAGLPREPGVGRSKASRWLREWSKSANFAAIMGIVAPILCLVLDPIVFRGGDEHGPMLGQFWIFAYSFIGLEVATLAAWLASRGRLGPCCGIAGGVLLGGAILAGGLGLILLPLSLVGLLIVIGLLGLTPWLTAYAYLRQGTLAWNAARARAGQTRVTVELCLGLLLAFGLPATAQAGVHRAWRQALGAVAEGDASARSRVEYWHRFMDIGGDDPLDEAIRDEPDPVRKQRLAQVRE